MSHAHSISVKPGACPSYQQTLLGCGSVCRLHSLERHVPEEDFLMYLISIARRVSGYSHISRQSLPSVNIKNDACMRYDLVA